MARKAAVRYISNYRLLTRKDYLVLPLSGDPMLVVPTLGQKLSALQASWIQDVRSGGDTLGMIREITEKIRKDGNENAPIGIVGLNGMPYEDYELLKKGLPQARFSEASELLNSIRAVKSDEEIEMVRATTEIADISYEILIDILRPGMDELEAIGGGKQISHVEGGGRHVDPYIKRKVFPLFHRPSGTVYF